MFFLLMLKTPDFLWAISGCAFFIILNILLPKVLMKSGNLRRYIFSFSNLKNTGWAWRSGLLTALLVAWFCLSWTTSFQPLEHSWNEDLEIEELEVVPPPTADRPPVATPPPPTPSVIEEISFDEPPPVVEPVVPATVEPDTTMVTPDTISYEPPPPPVKLPDAKDEQVPFRVVEEMPRFPGCEKPNMSKNEKAACAEKALLSYVYENVKYPSIARENSIQGTAHIEFIIEVDGSVSNIKVLREPGAGIGQEAQRVINKMKEDALIWSPGKQRGRPVRVRMVMPITFKLR